MAPPRMAAGRGGDGGQASDHIVVGSINRLGEAVDEEQPSVKQQEDVGEDQVTLGEKVHTGLGGWRNWHKLYTMAAVGKRLRRYCRNKYGDNLASDFLKLEQS